MRASTFEPGGGHRGRLKKCGQAPLQCRFECMSEDLKGEEKTRQDKQLGEATCPGALKRRAQPAQRGGWCARCL